MNSNQMASIQDVAQDIARDAVISKVATGASVGGGAYAFWGGYTLNEVAMIVGMVVAILGLLVQSCVQFHGWRARCREEKRAVILHRARMAKLKTEKQICVDSIWGDAHE